MTDKPSNSLKGPLTVLAGGICIGFAPIGLRLGLNDLGPQAIAFWRYLFAVPILLMLVFLIQKRKPVKPSPLIILAGVFFASDIALWHWGLSLTTVANATFIVGLGNLGVGFLAWVVLKERPSNVWFVAILVALIGAAALSLGGGAESKGVLKGDLLALGAAFLVSAYILCSKMARSLLSGIEAIFWLTVTELIVSVLWVRLSGESFLPATLSGLLVPLFLAIVVQVMGQGLIISGLGSTPASIAGVLIVVQPVVAAMVAWVLFDEAMTGLQFGGCALILGAIWLAQQGKPRTAPVRVPSP